MNKIQKIKHSHGFTLIETFVAITVLMIVVIGPLRLLSKAIADGNYAKQQITAYYLAQEGTELVVSKRDENVKNNNPWLQGLDVCVNPGCTIQADVDNGNSITVDQCPDIHDPCARLKQGESSKIYSHSIGEIATPFFRTVKITLKLKDNNKGAEVEVTVDWLNKGNFVLAPVHITSFIADRSL